MLAGSIAFLALGFGILLYSGDCLVRGALAAAYKTNVSPLLVGILIVGFGTSMPEFFIGINGAQAGAIGLAHGNIIGSNIANIWLVLAFPALIFPVTTTAPRMRTTALFMLGCTVLWIGVAAYSDMNAMVGAGFLALLGVYAAIAWFIGRRDTSEDTPEEIKWMKLPAWKMVVLILIGVAGLPLGARFLTDGGISLAKVTPLSEEAVGLAVLAVGSSLPELGAGIAAAIRKQTDIAMGNILGSSIFNLLGVGGAVALIRSGPVAPELQQYSEWAMLSAALSITLIVLLRRRVGWVMSAVFLVFYALYIYGLVQNLSVGDPKDVLHLPH